MVGKFKQSKKAAVVGPALDRCKQRHWPNNNSRLLAAEIGPISAIRRVQKLFLFFYNFRHEGCRGLWWNFEDWFSSTTFRRNIRHISSGSDRLCFVHSMVDCTNCFPHCFYIWSHGCESCPSKYIILSHEITPRVQRKKWVYDVLYRLFVIFHSPYQLLVD